MTEAYLYDKKQILPCAAYLEGEYGIEGVYFGVPVSIGAGGVERVVEIELSNKEKQEMAVSVSHVQDLVAAMDKVLAQSA
jgi:malate dehydrogenase